MLVSARPSSRTRSLSALAAVFALVASTLALTAAPAQAAPAISLTKSAPGSVLAGDTVTYTLTATNPGSDPLFNISFRDVLPNGIRYVAGSTTPVESGEPVPSPPGGQRRRRADGHLEQRHRPAAGIHGDADLPGERRHRALPGRLVVLQHRRRVRQHRRAGHPEVPAERAADPEPLGDQRCQDGRPDGRHPDQGHQVRGQPRGRAACAACTAPARRRTACGWRTTTASPPPASP